MLRQANRMEKALYGAINQFYVAFTDIYPQAAFAAKTCQVACVSFARSEEHTSELQSQSNLVCRLLLEKKIKHNNHSILNHYLPLVMYATTPQCTAPAQAI